MHGLMMQQPLLISSLLIHAERHHGEQEVVSRRVEGDIHRTTYRELAARSRRMANALGKLGVAQSDRVATLAWNGYRHLELYYAVSGSGAVLHTLNPRLHPDQVVYIADHAEDQVLFFDLTFLPLVEAVASRLKTVRHFVAMTDRAHMPASSKIDGLLCYEDLLDAESDAFTWPEFDENLASSLCYTSGTTGNPKGVLYSHRSTILHTFAIALPDSLNTGAADTILPVVPMFHVNAWGLPYAACMVGCKLVFPGPGLDGKSLHDLFESEGVTLSAGVPTVWQGLLAYVSGNGLRFTTMNRTVIGGSACPPAMMTAFQEQFGVQVLHAWGMTEMSPVGTVAALKGSQTKLDAPARFAIQSKQGRAVYGVDLKVTGPDGEELPWNGAQSGELLVRGPWIVREYFKGEGGDPLLPDAEGHGWFPTGDVANIDADGFVQLTDRSKDVIKSGGEWIGSIDLENIAMGHPAVAMAACIAAKHPKWDERPLLIVVKKPNAELTRDELIAFFEGRIAKWWTPDDVVFVDAIPLGATGKMLKNRLREQYGDRLLAGAAGKRHLNRGLAAAALAFVWWGFFPLYFRLLPGAQPAEVLANRIVWSLLLLAGVALAWRRPWTWLGHALSNPKTLAAFTASAALLSANWITYIWSVSNGHVVDASLGYFITPLVNVALGFALLGERLRRAQWIALAVAAAGVVWLTVGAGRLPWIGLVLGLSFGGYGLLRKVAALGALEGLTLETLLLAPFAIAAMAWWWGSSAASFPAPTLGANLWLIGLGPLTSVPLLLFASGARRLPLTTLGLMQYIAPTIQLVLGVWLFAEPFTTDRAVGFALIWLALALYTVDTWRTARRSTAVVPAVT